jgi:hypothetical protein
MPMGEGVYRPRLVEDYGGAAGVAMSRSVAFIFADSLSLASLGSAPFSSGS